MKLSDHVDHIRELTYKAFDKQFARLGIGQSKMMEIEKIPAELHGKRQKLDVLLQNHIDEVGNYDEAREKALDELTFTLFNRIAAIKVMEAHSLFPPIITKQSEHGDRSFGHKAWLEENPAMRSEDLEGIRPYIKHAFNVLSQDIPLYHKDYPYALLPYVIELNEIIDAFNAVEDDAQVEANIWHSDDILGWLYESYNNAKKLAFKESKEKVEYDKVSLQSQVYTPRWVVQFLVKNSLGKLYLEMYPDSEIKEKHKIANAPQTQVRERKPLTEIKLIDPASGSGNFLLFAYDLFYELYLDQIENYGAEYDEDEIPRLIIEHNLHGVDLDDRAIQLAQLGLFIKAKRKRRSIGSLRFNVVSSDFYLPEYEEVRYIFEDDTKLDTQQKRLIQSIWDDLKFAYKFGSLIKIEEKIKVQVEALYEKIQREGADLFSTADIQEYKEFEQDFFINLEKAVAQYAKKEGNSFMVCKTQDAITFLKLLNTKYDVATANPPYTDSSDFGKDLKAFIKANYEKPYKFHINLYATFIKRCHELTNEDGYIGLLHPLTFMYIKTFEGVRKYILEKTHIEILVELGLGGVFANSDAQVDVVMYILSKQIKESEGIYFDLKKYKNHTNKPQIFIDIYDDYIESIPNKHNYTLPQEKLKIIKSYPFIYWISDALRNLFGTQALEKNAKVAYGVKTGNNNGALRFWWEVERKTIYGLGTQDKNWVLYAKGGPYNKWYGNIWLCINWKNNGEYIKSQKSYSLPPQGYSFKPCIVFPDASSKGISFRYIYENNLYDKGSSAIFSKYNPFYSLALLNSKFVFYIVNCLNPTVSKMPNDIKRIPFSSVNKKEELKLSKISQINVSIKKRVCTFLIIETNFEKSPLYFNTQSNLKQRIADYLNHENHLLTQILINEAIINEEIFKIYELNENDIAMVLEKEGQSIGSLPVEKEAKEAYLADEVAEFPLENIKEYIQNISEEEFENKESVIAEFGSLYQSNNDLEEFCIRHQVNPINVWYWFKEAKTLPKQRMHTIAMEFLADMIREILMEDEDGIIPLVQNAGEKVLIDRIQDKFHKKGFSSAQFSSFDNLLGKELNEYINSYFFEELSNHLKVFKRLPATPFIWHLTSGEHKGFEAYIIIYKWSRDNLFRLKSVYIEHRERALVNRQSDLTNNNSAQAQNEKDLIYKQLAEIKEFKTKIDELLQEGYNPILDSGVGKNIAPLQKKKMLAYDVLNAGQLKKYLAADW